MDMPRRRTRNGSQVSSRKPLARRSRRVDGVEPGTRARWAIDTTSVVIARAAGVVYRVSSGLAFARRVRERGREHVATIERAMAATRACARPHAAASNVGDTMEPLRPDPTHGHEHARTGPVAGGGMTRVLDHRRRALLQGLAALAGIAQVPQGFAQGTAALSASQVTALQNELVGFAYADAKLANVLVRALTQAVGAAPLAQVAKIAASTPPGQLNDALRAAGVDKVAETILVALASGSVTTAAGTVVITYTDALAWRAVPWTKPVTFCGGMTDYWASAPAGIK